MSPLRFAIGTTLLSFVISGPLSAADSTNRFSGGLSDAATLSAAGFGQIVEGSTVSLAASGRFAVESIETVGEHSVIVLRGLSDAGRVSVKLGSQAVGAAALSTGTVIEVLSDAAGMSLIHGGQVLAYIPNEIGRSLIGQQIRR